MMGAAVLFAVAASSGCGPSGPEPFDVRGIVSGVVGNPSQITKDVSCTFTDATVSTGDPVVLRGSDGAILGKTTLLPRSMENVACSFGFKFDGIKAGESGYSIELAPYKPVVLSSKELDSKAIELHLRGPMDVLLGKQKPIELVTQD